MVRSFIILFVLLLYIAPVRGQGTLAPDLRPQLEEARQVLQQQKVNWEQLGNKVDDTGFAEAIIAPELVRFHQLQNKLELMALQVLYINFGHDYADFSIGPFQIKPSFAERIEKDILRISTKKSHPASINREERINRLNSISGQILYLRYFLQLMDHKYAHKKWRSGEEKLRFYATAYNCGYWHPESYIEGMMQRQHYKTTALSTNRYNYAEVALYYYQLQQPTR